MIHSTGAFSGSCLEDQDNACGIVRDVGFFWLLTRCWSGLVRMVATGSGYRRAQRSVRSPSAWAGGRWSIEAVGLLRVNQLHGDGSPVLAHVTGLRRQLGLGYLKPQQCDLHRPFGQLAGVA